MSAALTAAPDRRDLEHCGKHVREALLIKRFAAIGITVRFVGPREGEP